MSDDYCVQCNGPLGSSWMDTKTVCSRCVLNEHPLATQQPCWSDPGDDDSSDLEDPDPHCVHGCIGNESCSACGYYYGETIREDSD